MRIVTFPFNAERDKLLIDGVKKYGEKWELIRLNTPEFRDNPNCTNRKLRERYIHYLISDLKTGAFTDSENQTILHLYKKQ